MRTSLSLKSPTPSKSFLIDDVISLKYIVQSVDLPEVSAFKDNSSSTLTANLLMVASIVPSKIKLKITNRAIVGIINLNDLSLYFTINIKNK